jgi:predicted nucleic acid-binding protein
MEKTDLAFPKTFIDTLFVIALINRRDQYHTQARIVADEYVGRPLVTTEAVLFEIANALARGYKAEAVEIVEQFLSSEEVEVIRMTPELFSQAFVLYKSRPDKEWGLTDCLSFVVMQEKGIHRALTFDKHFVQAGFQAVLRDQAGAN